MIAANRYAMKLATLMLLILTSFLLLISVLANDVTISDADSSWNSEIYPVSSDVTDSTDALAQNLSETYVNQADTFLNLNMCSAPLDLIDSTDALKQNLSDAYCSQADSVWSSNMYSAPLDLIDSTDALKQNLADAYVSHADSVWITHLERPEFLTLNCSLVGNSPPCEDVTLNEVIGLINSWVQGHASLSEVIALINEWAIRR